MTTITLNEKYDYSKPQLSHDLRYISLEISNLCHTYS